MRVNLLICKLFSNNNRILRNVCHSQKHVGSCAVTGSYKAVFIGSDNFSLPSLVTLNRLLKPENVSVVVSSEGNVVSKFAKSQNQQIFPWNDFKKAEFDKNETWDFGVVASFGYLIPARVINRFPMGIFNVHASLLPRWRGASPINQSIINGDKETGISIMKIAPHKFDVGPVLLQKAVPLNDHIRAPELLKILADLGATCLTEVISRLPYYLDNPIFQDEKLVTLAPKLTPEIAEVDWRSKTALEIYRLYRGLYGTFKLRTTLADKRVDLDEIELVDNSSSFTLPTDGPVGQIIYVKNINAICVRCAGSSWVAVKRLKLGVKWMSAKDFKNGFLSKGKLTSSSVPYFYLDKSNIRAVNTDINNQVCSKSS